MSKHQQKQHLFSLATNSEKNSDKKSALLCPFTKMNLCAELSVVFLFIINEYLQYIYTACRCTCDDAATRTISKRNLLCFSDFIDITASRRKMRDDVGH